jgi:hypothetical protein
MSIDTIKSEINRFLKSSTPEVMAIKGSWGLGKTYSWNKFIIDAKNNNSIALEKYSYVSLFGLNSLDAFKSSIFEQVVDRELIGNHASVKTFTDNTLSSLGSIGRKSISLFGGGLLSKGLSPAAIQSLSFLWLNETLICIDDLERKGSSLCIKDVLGLVSLLKEQKKCKIVLLLNDAEDGLDDYIKYREKVIDIELQFAPTAKECAAIAFDIKDPAIALLSEFTQKLDIRNIRVLKKIERLVKLVTPILQDFEQDLISQVVQSLTLFSWCYYCGKDGKDIPPLDYVAKLGNRFWGIDVQDEQHNKWNLLLRSYGYYQLDELDLILADSVRNGYFDKSKILNEATKENQIIIVSRTKDSFRKAWDMYHDSFENNQDNMLNCLSESFMSNLDNITLSDLNNFISLLRELKENEKASSLIDIFIKNKQESKRTCDLKENILFNEVKDAEIIDKFNQVHQISFIPQTATQVLSRIAGRDGWMTEDIDVLANTSADQYYDMFKLLQGKDMDSYIYTCLRFGKLTNASSQHKKISENATEALKRIGSESLINKLRIRRFGIEIDNKE